MTPTSLNWYGLKQFGFDAESLGLTGNMLTDQVAIEALCVRIRHAEHEGGLGAFGHFKNYVDLLWNNPDSGSQKRFVWNPWANRMLRKAFEHNELAVAGPTCVSGDTRLVNPITGEQPTIQELCESNTRPVVQTLNGPVLAEVPYLKGTEPLYKFTLADGSSFKCTRGHYLLAADGWSFASSVRVGDLLHRYERIPLPTISGTAHTTLLQDARHYSQTTASSTGGCSACSYHDDAQLHRARELARASVPSPVDAPEPSESVFLRSDALSHGQAHTRPCLSSDPSTCSASHPFSSSETRGSLRFVSRIFSLLSERCQSLLQSLKGNDLPHPSATPSHGSSGRPSKGCGRDLHGESLSREFSECGTPFSTVCQSGQRPDGCCQVPETYVSPSHCEFCGQQLSWRWRVSLTQVVSIENAGVQNFYDLTVPVEHHYFAEGAIHHNSAGKCLTPETPVLMADGSFKKAGDITAGDKVMGDDFTPRIVQEVHSGNGPTYEVIPHDGGMKWFCTEDHTLVLHDAVNGKTVQMEAKEYEALCISSQHSGLYRCYNQIRAKGNDLTQFSLRKAGDMDWVGFSVDGNHRFLLGDFTVTHNSDPFALYGVGMYSIDPTHTLVLVMSTTIAGAKRRIWKTLREYWESISGLPGHALWSTNEIKGLNYQGTGYGQSSGIFLLASEQSSEKTAVDKLIGVKAPRTGEPDESFEGLMAHPDNADLIKHFDEETLRDLLPRLYNLAADRIGKLIVIFDEMTGAAESLLNAINTNLKPGNVGHFQIIGIGNPSDIYNPFGIMSRPKGGWDKVDLLRDDEWETATGGLCIRFDGEQNPRITEGNERYSWMLRQTDIQAMAEKYGVNSAFYMRMVRGTWCLTGDETGVYSPADIEMSGAKDTDVVWGFDMPIKVSFLDPSFTAGGDLAWATFGEYGIDFEGKKVLLLTEGVPIQTDTTDTTTPISFQIARAWRKLCEERGVKPQHAAYDRSGGGIPFGDIAVVVWSPALTGMTTGGAASRRPVPGEKSPEGRAILACDKFENKSSEVWFGAHPFFRSHQIKGVSDDLAKELCSRRLAKGHMGDGRKICVENKRAYKDREGKSPDQSDSFLGLVDFARDRLGFECSENTAIRGTMNGTPMGNEAWKAFRERARRLTKPRNMQTKPN